MGQTLHLHVGLPKCGSSSLQSFLCNNRARLLDRGFDYLDVSDSSTGNLTPYIKGLSGRGGDVVFRHFNAGYSTETAAVDLIAALEACTVPNVILSAESVAKRRQTHDFRELTDRFETVKVHIAFRPRVEWVVSHYAQGVKTGKYSTSLEDFLNSPRFRDHVVPMLTFSDHFEYWRNRVGADNLHVHFAGARFPSMVDQFLTALGTDLKAAETPGSRRNQSPSAFVLSALVSVRRKNRMGFLDTQKKVIRLATKLDPRPGASLLTREAEQFITPHFAEDTRKFLTLRSQIGTDDLWPDYSSRQDDAVTFDQMVRTPAYRRLVRRLAKKDIVLAPAPKMAVAE